MNYKLLPVIDESELSDALFQQYDVEIDIPALFDLTEAYSKVVVDVDYYCPSDWVEEDRVLLELVLNFLKDSFPYEAVILYYEF